mgnify:CR=1 FL=1
MKQHEREYFTSRIRSGIYKVQFAHLDLVIKPLTIEEELEVQEAYTLAFLDAEDDGVVSHDEMLENLEARGLWSKEDEENACFSSFSNNRWSWNSRVYINIIFRYNNRKSDCNGDRIRIKGLNYGKPKYSSSNNNLRR